MKNKHFGFGFEIVISLEKMYNPVSSPTLIESTLVEHSIFLFSLLEQLENNKHFDQQLLWSYFPC